MNKMVKILCFLFIGYFVLTSCGSSEPSSEYIAPLAPTLQVDLVRFEEILRSLPEEDLIDEFNTRIRNDYPEFAQLYVSQLVHADNPEALLEELLLIKNDTSYLQLYEEVKQKLGDLSDLKPHIDQALENYLEVFQLPVSQLPVVYTFISGFAYQAFVFDEGGKNGIGLGLDMFLGSDFPYQQIHPANPAYSQYLLRTFDRDHIIRKMTEVLVEDKMSPPAKSDFLTLMIWGGKKLYVIDEILDFVPDTIVSEYTKEQLDWCRNNEAEMWSHFFEEDLFYETDLRKFNKLIGPAPSSPGMPKVAPGQTGNYMGWQIIRAYMNRYPNTTIRELIAMQDAQLILDLSKYKPRRASIN